MYTEITDNSAKPPQGWIFFDAECRFCVAGRRRWGRFFERRGFVWKPLQTPGTASKLGVTEDKLMAEMWVLPAGGRPISGVAAWIELMGRVWWLWPLATLLGLPGINAVGQSIYRWIARNRYCIAGRCKLRRKQNIGMGALLLLTTLIVAVIYLGWNWSAWLLMWALAITLGQFLKWLGWRDAREAGLPMTTRRTLGWFLLWPGLDSRAFFAREPFVPRPVGTEWLAAATKLAVGTSLIRVAARPALVSYPLVTGWIAMVGIVLCLHFGLFRLLSLAWRTAGVNAPSIMNRPLSATSLVALWGDRWNTAFSTPARRYLFNPIARQHGTIAAHFAVFLASGLLHELVISLPARGGYGLPTMYFLLQGAGVMFERSRLGRELGLGRGARGWLFMMFVAVAPAFWLFHPPFIRIVILPMLQGIGAT